jgi:hypothetical protein
MLYNKHQYEKYNLFELMYLLNKSGLKSILNKKAIIDTFVDNKLEIEIDFDNDVVVSSQSNYMFRVQGNNIKWKLQKIIRQIYNIVILTYNKHIMEIHNGDIIIFNNNKYTIFMRLYQFLSKKNIYEDDDRYDTMCIIIENFETDEQKEYTTQELIDLFENEDITYIKTNHFNCLNAEKIKKS